MHAGRVRRLVVLAAIGVLLLVGLGSAERRRTEAERYAEAAARVLDRGYDATGASWAAARADLLAAGRSAPEVADLHPVLARATYVAGGRHSSFLPPGRLVGSDPRGGAPEVASAGAVTTLDVPALGLVPERDRQAYAATLAEGIAGRVARTCGWVVDLRGNTGGDVWPMLGGLSALLPPGPALAFRDRLGSDEPLVVDGGRVSAEGTTESFAPAASVGQEPVAVLLDRLTASSGEVVALAFRGLPNARSFGAPTQGLTSANEVHELADGALVVLTTAVLVDRTGAVFPEVPLQPDQPTAPDRAEEEARAWLAARGCR